MREGVQREPSQQVLEHPVPASQISTICAIRADLSSQLLPQNSALIISGNECWLCPHVLHAFLMPVNVQWICSLLAGMVETLLCSMGWPPSIKVPLF